MFGVGKTGGVVEHMKKNLHNIFNTYQINDW